MAIRWDKLTVKAQEAVQRAGELASERSNSELLPVHVLAALLEDAEGVVRPVLSKAGANPESLAAAAQAEIERLPRLSSGGAMQPHLSSAAQTLFDRAFKEAENFKDEFVSTEHLLLAVAQLKNDAAQQ